MAEPASLPSPLSPNQRAWRRFRRHRPAMISLGFLVVLAALVFAWPLVPGLGARGVLPQAVAHLPNAVGDAQFQPPGAMHWLGTDVHGRDLLARIMAGARISLLVGALGAAVSFLIGVAWGALAGFLGGRVDSLMMRIVDVLYALPTIIFVLVLLSVFNGHIDELQKTGKLVKDPAPLRLACVFVGVGAVSWLTMARIVRGQVLALRNRPFVDAARALGASPTRILLRHVLPNTAGVIIVYLTLTVPSVILYESFLSFLGFGIQPPLASWGTLIAEGARQINPIRIYWWLLVWPCVALISTLLALNFVGDGLRDAFDPRGQEQ